MTAARKRPSPGKRELYVEEARSLFLAGKSLEEISQVFPVPLQTLERWHQDGKWEEKRLQVPVSPRWLGEALKGVLREKAGKLLTKGDLKPQELEEITKIFTLIDRLCSQGWDIRAATLEVMDRFGDFLKRWVTDPDEVKKISLRMQEFFRKLEEESNGGS
ncbi:MAG: hypothetical protein Q8M54_01980 [Desulfobaccales bacterium]|nr:hypothetical protein [Desulfobaccales bacterium]